MKRLVAAATLLAVASPAFAAQPITGHWISDEGKALIDIRPCGKAVCGYIQHILKPTPDMPSTDVHNPDPALRHRPVIGLPVLTGFTDAGDEWKGTIYDAEHGKSYKSRVKVAPDGSLDVSGCVLFFCRHQRWTRAT